MSKRAILHLPLILFVALSVGCNSHPSDEQIQKDIQTKAAADPETRDSAIDVAAKDGKVTLTGTVRNETAGRKMKKIAKEEPGVIDVDDQTSIDTGAMEASAAPEPAPAPAPAVHQSPPPPPMVVPAGTELTVHLGQELSSKTSQTGSVFTATMANPITVEGQVAIPEGSQATGVVREAKKAGRFKGGATLSVDLTSIVVHGHHYNIQTEFVSQTSTGKGKRTAGMMAGGAGAGAAIGGLAGGGKGAAIGALAGVSAGTIGAATGNRDITLPAETALSFKLDSPLTLKP